ncbi:MAG: CoA-binding protein [Ignavibacteria bacterium]|nr:CoA-binding protein [Ignavibacteria bacterium]
MKKEKNLLQIQNFMKLRSFALFGASAKKKKFGNMILAAMNKKYMRVYPMHRSANFIDGHRAFSAFAELPEKPAGVILVIPPGETEHVIDDIITAGIKNVWFQQGSVSDKAVRYCMLNGINVISNECVLMFLDHPGFPHNLHKWVWSIGAGK